jgi:serine/threonine-protein kinase
MNTTRKRLLARELPAASGSGTTTGAIDVDLAVSRVRLIAMAMTVVSVFELLLGVLIYKIAPEFYYGGAEAGIPLSFLMIPFSLVIIALLSTERIPKPVRFGLAITYVLSMAVLLSAAEVSTAWWVDGRRHSGFPWVSVWILLVLIVVSIPWRRNTGRALLLSAIPPLTLFSGIKWFGVPEAPAITYLDFTIPCVLTAALGVVISRMMYRLRRQAQEAERLGSYTLEEQIGSGGMGEVWRASHRMLVRPAAIKLIRPEKLKEAMGGTAIATIDRFHLEAQATASLRSPHTVELYDFGVSDDGTFHYVMELLDGLDLEKLVKRFGPLQPGRAAFLLEQACDSLADAHANGLIHRDIKPANLYACRVGLQTDFVKILDFGLVKWTDTGGESLALTAEQAVMGTPAFLAPEVVAGEPADHRADIYSLGCVGYWLVTGQLLYEAEGALAMAVAHLNNEPVPPSERSEVEIPEEFEDIIMDCLAKDPADRPQTAAELGARLSRCECRDWTRSDAREWWDTHLPADQMLWRDETG